MTKRNPEEDLVNPAPVKSLTTWDVDRSLTPPRSSASSQIITSKETNNGASVSTPLVTLSEEILSNARILSRYYTENSLPEPSFDLDGPEDYSNDLPDEVDEVRAKLRSAISDMQILAAGPKKNIMWMAWSYHDVSLLHYVSHFKIAEAVPLHGTIAIRDVSFACITYHPA